MIQEGQKQPMNLYDSEIEKLTTMLESHGAKKPPLQKEWEMSDKENLILKSEMAYELGGGSNAAVSAIAFTQDEELVPEDAVYLVGDDLCDIKHDISYARITFIRFNDDYIKNRDDNALYASMRATDYVRYHAFPRGYMMRISSVREREPVRVSKEAVSHGINFAAVGLGLINAYRKRPEVEAVNIYFVTDQNIDFTFLKNEAHRCEQITDSLNHIFNGLTMDCSTCSSRELCDEIDGLRQIHMNIL